MSKKSDSFYFKNLEDCAGYSREAAELLDRNLREFDAEALRDRLDELHGIEHAADKKKHEMMAALVKEFITPIEREDIIALSHAIDEVTDKIEDVMIRVYTNNLHEVRPDAPQFTKMIIRCCKAMEKLMEEFRYFKKSKKIFGLMVEINTLEEEGDRIYIESMRRLHEEVSDPLTVITWRELYACLEKCFDACEHVANAVESVIMKNT